MSTPPELPEGAYHIRSLRGGHFMSLSSRSGFKGWFGQATGSQITFSTNKSTAFKVEKVDITKKVPRLVHDGSFMAGRSATGQPQPLYAFSLAHDVRETFINWDTNRFQTSDAIGPWELFELHNTMASPTTFFIYSPAYRCYLAFDAQTYHPNKMRMLKSSEIALEDAWEFIEA